MLKVRAALLAAICSLALVSPVRAQTAAPAVTAQAAILADLQTGKVLLGNQVHTPMAPASLTKIVTALVVRQEYRLDEIVTVTDDVNTVRGERLGVSAGQQMSVRELLYSMLMMSGNDTATALAAHHSGGYDAFIAAMNQLAGRIGAKESHFINPHGLDAPGHETSAWDMALFTRALLRDRMLAAIVATKTHPITLGDGTTRTIRNHNKLLFRRPEQTVGVKTGFTNRAGHCLSAAATTPAGTAITIVLKSGNHYGDTTAMWDWFATKPSTPSLGTLRLPAMKIAPDPAPAPAVRAASTPKSGKPKAGWTVLPMSVLAGAMLLTLGWPRRRAIADAVEHHPWLEPVLADD